MENNKNINNSQMIQSKVIPSYIKKEDKKKLNPEKDINKRVKSKIWIFLLLLLVISISVIILCITLSNTSKYDEYEEKMNIYGFNKLYDNGSAKSNEKVNLLELSKIVIASSYNISDITDKYTGELTYDEVINGNLSEDQINNLWCSYGQSLGFYNDFGNCENLRNKRAKLADLITYISKAKTNILNKTLDVSITPKFLDYDKYSNDEKIAIQDLAFNKILDDGEYKLNCYKGLSKGTLNRIIIKYVEKYNLITLDGDKININDEKKPINFKDFPYTLSSVKKDVYEIQYFKGYDEKFVLPVDLYSEIKTQYSNIKYTVEKYLETLYNIDYTTINSNKFKRSLSKVVLYSIDDSDIDEYIKYVKENEVVIQGNARVILPVIYYDGTGYRVRVAVNYNVKSAKKLNNLVCYDKGYTYDLGEKTVYYDILMQKEESGKKLYVIPGSLHRNISGKVYLSDF